MGGYSTPDTMVETGA